MFRSPRSPLHLAHAFCVCRLTPFGASTLMSTIAKELSASIKDGCLNVSIPLQEASLSKSGKSMVIASTHGIVRLPVTLDGKPIKMGLNAFV